LQRTKKLILSSLFAAITALLAQFSFPLPFSPVPLTGQTFAVFLTGALLGKCWGAVSLLIYILLGAAGLPVFHNAQGGLHIILGPTGGFLWGFVLGTCLLGKFVDKRDSYPAMLLGMFFCLLTYFSLGTLQLAYIAGLDLRQALMMGVLPFLPLDLVKLFAAAHLSFAVKRRLVRAGLLPATEQK
jgi:biotin transport system substrate-specific component